MNYILTLGCRQEMPILQTGQSECNLVARRPDVVNGHTKTIHKANNTF